MSTSSSPPPKPSTSTQPPVLHLLFFASAQSATRLSSLDFPLPSSSPPSSTPYTLPQLTKDLASQFPKLASVLETSSWAVNEEMVGEEEVAGWVLNEGDTVGVLPPVSVNLAPREDDIDAIFTLRLYNLLIEGRGAQSPRPS
ncbi:hypothetical protein BDY24DRAFT_412757 [Mrakia frigida]|uniref:uncharacterized protein n=1 Tax=Mrakia frigida TaxID=29902 RepID=UPI003FCBF3F7